MPNLNDYVNAMVLDTETGKPKPKVAAELFGSKGTKATGITLPISVAAGEHKTVATLTDLPESGVKRITFGYFLEASIPHQAYVNHTLETGQTVLTSLAGTATKIADGKEASVYAYTAKLVINNGDTVSRNVTSLEIWKWAN